MLWKSAPAKNEHVRQLVDEFNRKGKTYHKIDFGGGLAIQGEYDMARYVHHYGIPKDLRGKTVLDVGTATGYFAFECARRGAKVTAIDIWPDTNFNRIRDALGLDVKYVQKSLYDLDASFGQFDLVVCGSLLLHLRDIFGAVQKLRSVCKGQVIIATAAIEDEKCDHRPVLEFIGARAKSDDGEYWAYWSVNGAGMRRMLEAAEFSQVYDPVKFTLKSEPGMNNYHVPHIAIRAAA
jgi:tRNA (mo5U34)-methyltransferase